MGNNFFPRSPFSRGCGKKNPFSLVSYSTTSSYFILTSHIFNTLHLHHSTTSLNHLHTTLIHHILLNLNHVYTSPPLPQLSFSNVLHLQHLNSHISNALHLQHHNSRVSNIFHLHHSTTFHNNCTPPSTHYVNPPR